MALLDFLRGMILTVPDKVAGFEPFEDFTRPLDTVDPLTLKEKADFYWKDIQANWKIGPEKELYSLHRPESLGDLAMFHGLYTAACAFGNRGMRSALDGATKLQELGGNSRLSRGFIGKDEGHLQDPNHDYYLDGEYLYKDNCSESSIIGHIFGLWAVRYKHPATMHSERAGRLLVRLARQIIEDGYRLKNQDDTNARHGDLRPPAWWAPHRDPVRSAALGVLLLLAYDVSRNEDFLDRYKKLARNNAISWGHLEVHFVFVYHEWYRDILGHLLNAMLITTDKWTGYTKHYCRGYNNLWCRTKKQGNPIYCFLRKEVTGTVQSGYIDQAMKTLHEFNTDPKNGPTAKEPAKVKNTGGPYDVGFVYGPKWLRGGKPHAKQPLPIHRRTPADFFFQRNPYELDGSESHHYNGLDFLLSYYMGKSVGAF